MTTITKTATEIQNDFNKSYEHTFIYVELKPKKKYMLVGIKELNDGYEFTYGYKDETIVMEYSLVDKIKVDVTAKASGDYNNVIEKYFGIPVPIIQLIRAINIKDARIYDRNIMQIAGEISGLSDGVKSLVYGWVDYIGDKHDLFIDSAFVAQQVFYRFCDAADIKPMEIKIIPSYVWLMNYHEIEKYIEEEMGHYIDPYGTLEMKYRLFGNSIFYLSEETQEDIAELLLSNLKEYVRDGVIPNEVAVNCINDFIDAMYEVEEVEEMEEMEPGVTIH